MKNLIKYFILFLTCSYLLIGTSVFADSSANCNSTCKLSQGTPQVLLDYIDDLHKVITNVTKEANKNPPEKYLSKTFQDIKSRVFKIYSLFTDWEGYFSSFDFYVVYPISNEYVYEIRRDYNMLEQESSGIERYKKVIINKGLANVELKKEDICKGIETRNCNIGGGNILEVLSEIQNNNEKIKDYFRLSILDQKSLFNGSISLVGDDFKQKFNEYYNAQTTSDCSSCEGGFFDKIEKAIENISNLQELAKNGLKEWKIALSMIDGTLSQRQYEEMEREVLLNELGRQGVAGSQADAILNNLERYNNGGGYSEDNNFITNSFNNVANSIRGQLNEFAETVLQNINISLNRDKIPLDDIKYTGENIVTANDIGERIKVMYQREIPGAETQDTGNEELQAKIIQMHYNLSQAIKVLDEVISVAEKVCNQQGSGMGRCSY